MPKQTHRRYYPGLRKSWPGFTGVIWLVWSFTVVTGLALIILHSLSDSEISGKTTYLGTLRPKYDPVTVNLPAGAILEDILFEPGQDVKKGQTLAVLDQEAMTVARNELESALRVHAYLLKCLKNYVEPVTSSEIHETQISDLEIARVECETTHARGHSLKEDLATQLAQLKDEQNLLYQYQNMNFQQNGDHSDEDLRTFVSLSIARNQIERQQNVLKSKLRASADSAKGEKLARMRAIARDSQNLIRGIAALDKYIANPRILSPSTGQVSRIRRFGKGAAFGTDRSIAQIDGNLGLKFEASFIVPKSDVHRFVAGDRVSIRVLHLQSSNLRLSGIVQQIANASGSDVLVEISSLSAGAATLDNVMTKISFHGRSSAAQIEVSSDDSPVWTLLRRALQYSTKTEEISRKTKLWTID